MTKGRARQIAAYGRPDPGAAGLHPPARQAAAADRRRADDRPCLAPGDRRPAIGPVVVACAEPRHRRRHPRRRRRGRADRPRLALRHRPRSTQALRPRRPRAALRARRQPPGRSADARSGRLRQRRSSRSTGSAPTWRPSPPRPRTSRARRPERRQGGAGLLPDDPSLGRALYFTRATAPTGPGPVWHHIGIYAFTRDALERFATLPPSPLEQRERLEQLRALEHGMTIGVELVARVPFGVDTPERPRAGAPHPGDARA